MADVESTSGKKWVTLFDGDTPLGIFIDGSAAMAREVQRLTGYMGFNWRKSTEDDLTRFKRTVITYENKRRAAALKRKSDNITT